MKNLYSQATELITAVDKDLFQQQKLFKLVKYINVERKMERNDLVHSFVRHYSTITSNHADLL